MQNLDLKNGNNICEYDNPISLYLSLRIKVQDRDGVDWYYSIDQSQDLPGFGSVYRGWGYG